MKTDEYGKREFTGGDRSFVECGQRDGSVGLPFGLGCTHERGHLGRHSWHQDERREKDRVDHGGIERAVDAPAPIPLPELPEGYTSLGGLHRALTDADAPELSVQGAGAYDPKQGPWPIPPPGQEARWNESQRRWDFKPYSSNIPTDVVQARGHLRDHYKQHPTGIECIDVIEHFSFNIGTAMKYLWRADYKGSRQVDLEKAKYYIERELKRGTGGN